MTTFETRRVVVNGVCSPVLIGGAGESGEVVVFVHGNPDAGGDWEPLMKPIADFAVVVAPDMPGFGGADKRTDQDYTLAACGAHLGGVIDQLGITAVHLVAHDFGGPFALNWAAANPGRVATVTLINTGVLLDYKWHRLARVWRTPIAGELFMRATTRRMARLLIRHDNPGLSAAWATEWSTICFRAGTMRVVLRLYRSTRQEDMDAWSNRCGAAIPTRWWCSAPRTFTSRPNRPNASAACSRARRSKSAWCRSLGVARATRSDCRICGPVPACAGRQDGLKPN